METVVFGEGMRQRAACLHLENATSSTEAHGIRRTVLLPIPTTKDEKTIHGTDVSLSELADMAGSGDFVIGYGIPEKCADFMRERGAVVYDALYDEKFQEENAYLTALGAVAKILTCDVRSPKGIRLGVVGYGRIGKEIVKIWLFLGGSVRVFSGRRDVVEALVSVGVSALTYGEGCDFSGVDILINTAPAPIINSCDTGLSDVEKIIDLASGEYLKGIPRVEKMPSIPAKMYPESAGKIYAERAISYLGGVK